MNKSQYTIKPQPRALLGLLLLSVVFFAVGLIIFAQVTTRQMKRIPAGAQNFWEWLVEGLRAFHEQRRCSTTPF